MITVWALHVHELYCVIPDSDMMHVSMWNITCVKMPVMSKLTHILPFCLLPLPQCCFYPPPYAVCPSPPYSQGIMFEKLSEEDLQNRIDIMCNRKPRSSRQSKAAERKRITQELARRAAFVKEQKKLEQQGKIFKGIWSKIASRM